MPNFKSAEGPNPGEILLFSLLVHAMVEEVQRDERVFGGLSSNYLPTSTDVF